MKNKTHVCEVLHFMNLRFTNVKMIMSLQNQQLSNLSLTPHCRLNNPFMTFTILQLSVWRNCLSSSYKPFLFSIRYFFKFIQFLLYGLWPQFLNTCSHQPTYSKLHLCVGNCSWAFIVVSVIRPIIYVKASNAGHKDVIYRNI